MSTITPSAFRNLNRLVEPAARRGLGAPLPIPVGWWAGLVVIEVPGRKSGRIYRTPLLAFSHRDLLVVTTVRSRSQWIRNLAATDTVDVWLRGSRREHAVHVWGAREPTEVPSIRERIAFRSLGVWCDALGASGALLTQRAGDGQGRTPKAGRRAGEAGG